jgi:hypothetical protein
MSKVPSTSTDISSTNFKAIFTAVLEEYKQKAKRDSAFNSLAVKLESCRSPDEILDLLRPQVRKIEKSQSANEKWMKWVDPIVNVLYAFSATLGSSVGLVIARH